MRTLKSVVVLRFMLLIACSLGAVLLSRPALTAELPQAADVHALQLVGGQKSRTAESTGVGAGTGDVVVGQAPVELRGLGQSGQFRRRTRRKATTPQGQMFVVLSHEGSLKSENSCV